VLSARRPGETVSRTSDVVPALVAEPVEDRHTVQAGELRAAQRALADPATAAGELVALRRSALTSRDHVIGLEAQLGRLRLRLASVNRELGALKEDNDRTHAALGSALDDATHAHAELARSIADSQQAHAELGKARAEVSSVHQRLAASVDDARQAHRRLGEAQSELVEVHRQLDRATGGVGRRSPLRRMGAKVRRTVGGIKRRLR
jgi:chromosome segregation ATPase